MQPRWPGFAASLLWAVLLLAGCGSAAAPATPSTPDSLPTPASDARTASAPDTASVALGEELFHTRLLKNQSNGCINCHTIGAGELDLQGPNLAGIASTAATRVPGQSAAAYLRTSIVDPAAYEVAGWSAEAMPANYAEILTDAEIESLVRYMLTLEE